MRQILLIAAIVTSLYACGNSDAGKSTNDDPIAPETTPPVNRQGATGMDTSTSLPSDTMSKAGMEGTPQHNVADTGNGRH